MGQKVNPTVFRKGVILEGNSKWFTGKREYAAMLQDDRKVRKFIHSRVPEGSAVSKILIERRGKSIKIVIRTAKPGVLIGRKGEYIDNLKASLTRDLNLNVQINVEEIRHPEIDAILVAQNIAQQLEKRIMYRRAMKRAIASALRQGALGIKVAVAGRLNGAEIARTEWIREGRVPLHTIRADIDYGLAIAKTTYGVLGVKVWIFKGEVINKTAAVTAEQI